MLLRDSLANSSIPTLFNAVMEGGIKPDTALVHSSGGRQAACWQQPSAASGASEFRFSLAAKALPQPSLDHSLTLWSLDWGLSLLQHAIMQSLFKSQGCTIAPNSPFSSPWASLGISSSEAQLGRLTHPSSLHWPQASGQGTLWAYGLRLWVLLLK